MSDVDIFKAIADPTRRQIMGLLAEQELSVNEVSAHFEMTRPAVAKHLGILREAGLIEAERQGRETRNRLRPGALRPVAEWLNFYSQFWDDKLAKLKLAVEDDT